MKTPFRRLGMALLAACAAGALLAAPVSARDFRSADIHPADYPTVEAVKYMGKLLSERTGGKLGVKVCPNGARGDGVSGATAACFSTWADCGISALRIASGSCPRRGRGAWSLAPTGLWPMGRLNGASLEGLGIWTAWFGSGCAAAEAPSQGSACAGGATPAATQMQMTKAADIGVVRRRGDMSPPLGQDAAMTSAVG